jgi:uncharacterized protein YjiK
MSMRICLALIVLFVFAEQTGCSNSENSARDSHSPSDANNTNDAATAISEEGGKPIVDSSSTQESSVDSTSLNGALPEATIQTDAIPSVDSGSGLDSAQGLDAVGASDEGMGTDTGAQTKCPPLNAYGLKKEVTLSEPNQASGIGWNRDTGSFFVVSNLQGEMWEYDKDFTTALRTITLRNMDMDTEGIEYLQDGWVAISVESNAVYAVRLNEGVTTISASNADQVEVYQPCGSPPVNNKGLEGLAYKQPRDGQKGRIFTCQEGQPMRVLQFDIEIGSPPFTKKSALDGTLQVDEPWNAEEILSSYVTDIAGMTYDETNDNLLIVSQQSSCVIRVNPQTGDVLEKLSLVNTTSSEGIALFDTCQLAVVSEPNRVQIYGP